MLRFTTYTCLIIFISMSCAAQSPRFYLGFDQILDNREYFTEYGVHQTIFGARLNPGLEFRFDSAHSISTGVNYMYEFGGSLFGISPQIDLYYRYQSDHLNVNLGSFPRRELLDYPLFLLTDSLMYYRPNMEGALVQYQGDWGSVRGWVDWTGRESEATRESILAGIDANLRIRMFYLKAITTRYHLARTTAPEDNNQLRDDGAILVLGGTDLSQHTFFDRLNFSTGLASTYLRARPADYIWNKGWLTTIDLTYGIFGFDGSYYVGDPSPLVFGEPLYRSGNYGRAGISIDPFKNPRISSRIAWNFHFLPGDGVYQSQQLLLTVLL
jgi:hypothetical protein